MNVSLPPALLRLFPQAESRLDLDATSVAEVIHALDQRWPGIRNRLCDATPAIRPNLAVFVDGVRADLDTPLQAGSDVFIITRISGG